MNHQQFFSSNNFLWREHLKWKATPCCVLIQFLTSFWFQQFFSSNNFLWREHLKWKATPCCVLIQFLTSFDFKFDWVSRTNKCLLTSSILSGSDADASHLLCTMKMFGFERCWFTLWKNFFSCKWQGYQLRNCPTSIGRLNLWMLPQWTCNKSHFKATEILKTVPSNLNFVCIVS